jgi:hypothetical protein
MDEKDDISSEFLHHALMNETRDYLARGRRLVGSSDHELQDVWVAAFERWFEQRTREMLGIWTMLLRSSGFEIWSRPMTALKQKPKNCRPP